MSLKLVNINLSFSSQEDSTSQQLIYKLHLPSQLNSQADKYSQSTNNSQHSEHGLMRCPLAEKNPHINPVPIIRSNSNNRKIKFLKPVLSLLKIPKPLAPASQLGLFDFPVSGTVDNERAKTEEYTKDSLKPNRSSNYSSLSVYNRSTRSLYQTEIMPLAQNNINREVLRSIRRLMKEIKFVKKKYCKRNVISGGTKCSVADLSSEADLQLPTYFSSQLHREL